MGEVKKHICFLLNTDFIGEASAMHKLLDKKVNIVKRKERFNTKSNFSQELLIQRKILVGNEWLNHTEDSFLEDIEAGVKPRLNHWRELKDKVFKKNTNAATNSAIKDYYELKLPDVEVTQFESDILASLRKHNSQNSFADKNDLYRQIAQDIKLKLLKFNNIAGIPHHDGQFKKTDDNFGGSASGRNKNLVIYRTMPKADWVNYKESGDLKDILYGHGGSLGQAMHYFYKSKKDNKDDVLVEFKFSKSALELIDYSKVNGGGEGGTPKNGQLTGKSEQNDLMNVDDNVFSIHLHKSKDLIKELKPKARLIAQVQ